MGHLTFSEVVPIKTAASKIVSTLASRGSNEWQGERRCTMDEIIGAMNVVFDKHVCSSYEEAREWADKDDKHYWGEYIKAVPFCDVKSKKLDDLDRRIRETAEKKKSYITTHRVGDFKAEFIGCPSCKSKIARYYFEKKKLCSAQDLCPVCHADMASETTKKTLKGYDEKIKSLQKEKEALQKKLADKPTHYYCMCEVHC